MGKLHELLAVESNLETQAAKCRTDLANTFEKKRHLFEEKRIVFTPNAENAHPVTESQSDIQTSVKKELGWLQEHLAKAWDASFQVALANTFAKGNVVLEDSDVVLINDIPATALLELEKRLVEVQELVSVIPTLDPAKGFRPDPQRGEGIFQAREVNKTRTKKEAKVIVKYDATKEHPAQTELINVDSPVGTITEQEWSSLITPAEKSELLDHVSKTIRAVKQARSRANSQEVDSRVKIGNRLLGYIFNGQ